MKKQVFYLQPEADPLVIVWLNYAGQEAIATGDLICLINEYYYPN